jgi:serine/threonine protein kinase
MARTMQCDRVMRSTTGPMHRAESEPTSREPLGELVPRVHRFGLSAATSEPEMFGPYRVYEQLGGGGMGCVHRAERMGVDGRRKSIALKRLWPERALDPRIVHAFRQEGQVASRLDHPNIARTFSLGNQQGTDYITMEYVPGRNLANLMRLCRSAGVRLPIPLVHEILIQLCDALDHIHSACDDGGLPLGIVHRDVSPSNLIISIEGVVKLIDFGVVKTAHSNLQTRDGVLKGKLGYFAPEYLIGHLDFRADLFAVGVIAHEMLTLEPLFLGKTDFATYQNILHMPVMPPSSCNPNVPAELDDIVMTALNRHPGERWQSAAALRRALFGVASQFDRVNSERLRDWVSCAMLDTAMEVVHPDCAEISWELISDPACTVTPMAWPDSSGRVPRVDIPADKNSPSPSDDHHAARPASVIIATDEFAPTKPANVIIATDEFAPTKPANVIIATDDFAPTKPANLVIGIDARSSASKGRMTDEPAPTNAPHIAVASGEAVPASVVITSRENASSSRAAVDVALRERAIYSMSSSVVAMASRERIRNLPIAPRQGPAWWLVPLLILIALASVAFALIAYV